MNRSTLARGQDFTIHLLLISAVVITFGHVFTAKFGQSNLRDELRWFKKAGQRVLYVKISDVTSAKGGPLAFLGSRPMEL